MIRAIRIAAAVAPFLVWLCIAGYVGATGIYMVACLVSAIAGGAFLYYYVIPHGMAIHAIPVGRACVAFVLCVALPLFFCWGADKAGSPTSRAGQPTSRHDADQTPTEAPVLHKDEILTRRRNVDHVAINSFERGMVEAYDPPKRFGRCATDIRPVLIGTNKWRICFQTPGPAMIMTGLPIRQGDSYYIKMDREACGLQFGWFGEDGKFAPSPASASALVASPPHRYRMNSHHNSGAQLAFYVSNIPNGRYEIVIAKSPFNLAPNEYAPGVLGEER